MWNLVKKQVAEIIGKSDEFLVKKNHKVFENFEKIEIQKKFPKKSKNFEKCKKYDKKYQI